MSIAPQDQSPENAQIQGADTLEAALAEKTKTGGVPTGTWEPAYLNVQRQLDDDELKQSGAQKMLLANLDRAEAQALENRAYVDRFHAADKSAAVLQSRLKTQNALEVLYGVGLAAGGVIVGMTPSMWAYKPLGPILLGIGIVLFITSIAVRIILK
jgi:hypothetical protein